MSFTIRADGIMDPNGKYPNPLTGQPYSPLYNYYANKTKDGKPDGWTNFQPWKDRIEILKKIHKYNILLAKLPPGTGKTVILPKLLLHYCGYTTPVICTTPRQVTTNGAAEYAAKCLDVPFYLTNETGEDLINPDVKRGEKRYDTGLRIVGYKHGASKGMDNANTKLLFCTDGTLKQKILSGTDTILSKYGGVVIDEAHERSVNIDVVIALLMDIIKVRPDFKVIIMSATIDLNLFKDYCKRIGLGHAYGVYELPDIPPLFERRTVKDSKKMDTGKLVEVVYNRINEIILNPKYPVGDILAFVTSDAETAKVKKRIENNMRNYPVNNKPFAIAFSAQVSDNDKNIAKNKGSLKTLPPSPDAPQGYSRKVIIGTNAVESSVTFGDPLVYVIETGLAYEKIYDAEKYAYVTGKNYVSKASIDQRCGRTGRTCDGWCFQLYTEPQFKEFEEYTAPKIRVEDMTKELLSIISLPMNGNLQKGMEFIDRMIEPRKNYQIAITRAYNNLVNMDFLDAAGNITFLGYVCNQFNKFDLKIAKMVIGGFYLQCPLEMMALGAILQTVRSIDEIFYQPPGMDEDPALERQYIENIKRVKDDRGDHMTLLRLYILWAMSPNPNDFATQNGLNAITLKKIQDAYGDLSAEVNKLMPQISSLNLFSYPGSPTPVQYGGRMEDFMVNGRFQNIGYKFDGEVDYDDSSDDSSSERENDSSSDASDDSDEEEMELNTLSRMPSKSEIDTITNNLAGGMRYSGFNNFNVTNNTNSRAPFQELLERFENEDNYKSIIQNHSGLANLSNKSIAYGGGNIDNDSRATHAIKNANTNSIPKDWKISGGQYTSKTKSRNTNQRKTSQRTSRLTKKQIAMQPVQAMQNGGGDDKEQQKKVERNKKIMEVITLKHLPHKVIMPPADLYDRIYAALYYGYSNNIAATTGSGKKYYVKFSPEKATIAKSVFDYNDKIPTWVIYHEFTIMKTIGRPDEAKLNIVSELNNRDFLFFLDVNEIRKQL